MRQILSDFQSFARQHRPAIEQQLDAIFTAELKTASPGSAYAELITDLAALVARGGKRLRPLLATLTYQGYGGGSPATIVPVAAAQELVHTFLLIHDDIIDRDDQRWGGPNISGVYAKRYARQRDAKHFALAQALLAGDSCLLLAQRSLQQADCSPVQQTRLQAQLQQACLQVLRGETNETAFAQRVTMPSESEIRNVYRDKTASYSFALPLLSGAILAGASQAELAQLSELAIKLGLAFQLQDDLLGMFGNQQLTGKSVTTDLAEAKRTVLLVRSLKYAEAGDRAKLRLLIGRPDLADNDMHQAQKIIRASGAYNYVQQQIMTYSQAAQNQLAATNMQTDSKRLLKDLIDQLINRDH